MIKHMNIYCIIRESNAIKRIQLSQDLHNRLNDYLNESITPIKQKKTVLFSGEYKPEENEILYIENFDNPHINIDALSTGQLDENEIESIKTLVFKMDDKKIAYQCFDNRKIIRPEKWFLIYSNNTYCKIDNRGLIIDNKIDAIFCGNKLLFSSYHNASKIFDLSRYYREATDNEIENFIKNKIIKDGESFDKNLLNSKMKKKIYLILKNNVLKQVKDNFESVAEYSEKVGMSSCFDKSNTKIIFPNDKNKVEKLLNFLNDDLYNSPITGNNYETNSKRKIS